MDASSFSTNLWAEVKTLSLNDTVFYIDNTQALLQPDGKLPSIWTNPESYNTNALEAILLLHRYSLLQAPSDISRGSLILLNHISLAEEPRYASFFFAFASRSLDLFERSTYIEHLNRAIALLEYFHEAQEPGTNTYVMASLISSRACMQYYLKAGEIQALDSGIEILKAMRQASHGLEWMKSSSRTLLVMGEAMRYLYENFHPLEDFDESLAIIKSVLETIPVAEDRQFTSFQVLVKSLILALAQEADPKMRRTNLHALYRAVSLKSDDNQLSETGFAALSRAIDQCSIASANRPLCLMYTADALDSDGFSPLMESEVGVSQWSAEWNAALLYLQQRIEYFDAGKIQTNTTHPPVFHHFLVNAKVEDRPSLGRQRFRAPNLDEGHVCIFRLMITPVVAVKDESETPLTHMTFCRHFHNICEILSSSELDRLIDHPNLEPFFGRSRYLKGLEKPLATWKKSPAIVAYLIYLQGGMELKSLKKAAKHLQTVQLDREPGHSQFFYRLGADLREFETNSEAVGLSLVLLKEFLRVQDRGTPRHFVGVTELASTFTIDFLSNKSQLPLFNVALELFREAISSQTAAPWLHEARKFVVIGRILHIRFRYFSESDELLDKTITELTALWDILPVGRPFRVSISEMILLQSLLHLSQDLSPDDWLKALKQLVLTMDLYLSGTVPQEEEFDVKDAGRISGLLLSSGIDTVPFSLASRAMCIVHLADMLRTTAIDVCRNPGFLRLSLEFYERSLKSHPENFAASIEQMERLLSSSWESERAGIRSAVISLSQQGNPILSAVTSLSIFEYGAGYMTPSHAPRSYSHHCILHYYPTWVSYISADEDSDSFSTEIPSAPSLPPWPEDLMSFPGTTVALDQGRRYLPSTIIPGIDKVMQDEGNELFRMPLELRTIRAFMRSLGSELHHLEKGFSHLSEAFIRQSSEKVYWNPRDIQLGARIAHLKETSPYLARIGPLQALLSRGPERCLELVESSRTLFWNRLLRLQTSFSGLPDDLAHSLESTAHELDKCKAQFVASVSKEDTQWQFELESLFNRLLGRARQVPGFENLLMPKNYQTLMNASSGGPIVVLLGNDSTYAALVVRPSGVDSVFLPDLTDLAIEKLVVGLNKASRSARSILQDQDVDSNERYMRLRKPATIGPSHETLLDGLWRLIVKPVFDFMGLLVNPMMTQERSRLWWCPTGRFAFLPIHAAGNNFGKPNVESTSKYVVSSYIPTLSSLITAREKTRQNNSKALISNLKALVLAQPKTKGQANLPMTVKELELIETLIPHSQLLYAEDGPLSRSNANRTVEEVMKYLADASILHLACHGHQDRTDPLNSGFELTDGRLSLSKLMSCRNPDAFLGFLSACESAANDLDVPDESLNLAAAMLFAGFRSIIGTMWTMNDNDGPEVTRSVYEELFKNPADVLNPDLVPYALDAAIRKLQQNGIDASRWATYIHVGM